MKLKFTDYDSFQHCLTFNLLSESFIYQLMHKRDPLKEY